MTGGRAPGLTDVRPDLEHKPQPADPFAVSVWLILDVLHDTFGTAWHLGYANKWWRARRIDGTGEPVKAMSPDDLIRKIRAVSGGASC